jgi:2'-hydroxyisoflavone reductase
MPDGLDPYTLERENMGKYYGPLKARAEQEVHQQYAGRWTVIRPGLIVGPLDRSDRFTFWPVRLDRGGEVLAPGTMNDRVQIIDARDIAEWTIRVVENSTFGTFNAAGPRSPLTMAEQLYGIRAAFDGNRDIRFTWVPADFLAKQKVAMWSDMPTWIPKTDSDYAGEHLSIERAGGDQEVRPGAGLFLGESLGDREAGEDVPAGAAAGEEDGWRGGHGGRVKRGE